VPVAVQRWFAASAVVLVASMTWSFVTGENSFGWALPFLAVTIWSVFRVRAWTVPRRFLVSAGVLAAMVLVGIAAFQLILVVGGLVHVLL
jgi:hypothetical protein